MEGRLVEDPNEIKAAAVDYFRNNFLEERTIQPGLGDTFILKIRSEESLQLERSFEEKRDRGNG